MYQPDKVSQACAWSAEQGKLIFLCPRSRLRIWSRETGSAVPTSRVVAQTFYIILTEQNDIFVHSYLGRLSDGLDASFSYRNRKPHLYSVLFKAGRPGSSEVPRNPLTRWDVRSITANGIFLTKKLKNKIKMPNEWRTIKSLVHKIRLHGRRGKGMAESFSREKLRHAPQKEGG